MSTALLRCNKAPQVLAAACSSKSYQLLKQTRDVSERAARFPLRLLDQSLGAQSQQIGPGALTPP
jgi:hypothetical protein